MKNPGWAIVLLVIPIVAGACNREPEPTSNTPRVALVLKTLNNPFFIDMQRGAEEASERLGVELVIQAAERELDVEKQMQIVENLIQTRVDAICLTPSGSREIVPAVAKANAAGIPVVILDTQLDPDAAREAGVSTVAFIGSDNYEGGRTAAQFLKSRFPDRARIVLLEGIPGHETGDSRLRGFRDAFEDRPSLEIVASQPANWERDQGFNVMQNLLQAHPEIDAVFACNDLMALGAIEAIAAAGRTEEITVVGFDAVVDGREAIAQGKMAASVAQFPAEIGRLGVETAVLAIRREPIPSLVPVRIELITEENLGNSK